ncbi:transporter [Ganoderma sinense ZZ0214-1]|uniref:Transporter n=1 Tax=Ganoderma sinense ZZ0214-1 TaxID=1077348 RepID=A0A2G8S999_9APHY|nr:transporter [Ganoderma sinense ZZ0214-1]
MSKYWSKLRVLLPSKFIDDEYVKEPAAEFLGVMILVLFGNGAACQTQLSANKNVSSTAYGDALSIDFGFAVGLGLGGWVAGLVSKGHINPAVTIAMATFRPKDFPWSKVPAYILGQVLGGLCGAGIVYANYIHAIDLVEGGRHVRTVPGTASLFWTYALPYMTAASAWFEEFLGTALLLVAVCAMGNAKNPSSTVLAPLVLFVTMLGISASFGMQTGFAINPARDLGPRLLTAMVGYGAPVFTFRNQYWLWCPILAPIAGALVGTFLYDLLFYTGKNSILRKRDEHAPAGGNVNPDPKIVPGRDDVARPTAVQLSHTTSDSGVSGSVSEAV